MQVRISPTLTIEYEDNGQGRPVVLLHAFPLSHAMWRRQVEALSAEYRVIAPDLRGFGGTSAFEGTPSVEQMADDVAALLDALDTAEPIALGGLSMGGYVALAFARRYPARLRALVLADTRAEPDTTEAQVKRDENIQLVATHGVLPMVEQMLPKLVATKTQERKPAVIEEITAIGGAQTPDGIMDALRALRERPDARSGLGAIQVPTMVIVGSDDILTPPEVAQTLQSGIAGAQFTLIQDAGHLSNLEQPTAFNEAVLNFLRSFR